MSLFSGLFSDGDKDTSGSLFDFNDTISPYSSSGVLVFAIRVCWLPPYVLRLKLHCFPRRLHRLQVSPLLILHLTYRYHAHETQTGFTFLRLTCGIQQGSCHHHGRGPHEESIQSKENINSFSELPPMHEGFNECRACLTTLRG